MFNNPFGMINKDEIVKRVEKMRAAYPALSRRELCELIIADKARKCGLSGAVTALPAALPGIGTVVALLAGTGIDVMVVRYLMAEMVLEMSAVYGRNLNMPGVSKEALWVMGSAVGADTANKALNRVAVEGMSNRAFVRLVQEILLSLGVKASQRTVLRIIPLLGAAISGAVNYVICRRVGGLAANYYDRNGYDQWDKSEDKSIDVEGEVLE
ncbi:MAG: EcsC family protein [Firmicutes bacterium]|nr:EcsC family protein [Bacillota bacterium]